MAEIEAGCIYFQAVVVSIHGTGKRIFVEFRYAHKLASYGQSFVSRSTIPKLYEELCGLEAGDIVYASPMEKGNILSCEKVSPWKRFLNRTFRMSLN